MASLGSLFAVLKLDSRGFSRSMNRAKKQLKDFSRDAAKFSAQLTGFLGVGSFAGLGILARNTVKYGDAVGKTADKIGLSTKALQEWRYVAELSGVEANTFDIAIQRFGRRLGEAANGTGELKDALARMNISVRNQDGSLRDVDSVLREYLDKLGRIEDVTVRNSLAMKGFDSEGVKLVNIAKMSSKEIAGLVKEFNDLGGVMDEEAIRKSEEVNNLFEKFSTTLGVTARNAITGLLPKLEAVMRQLTSKEVQEGLKTAAENIFNIASAFFKGAGSAAKFFDELGKGIGIKTAQLLNPNLEDQINALEAQKKFLQAEPTREESSFFLRGFTRAKDEIDAEIAEIDKKLIPLRKQAEEYQKLISSFTNNKASQLTQPADLKKDPFVPESSDAINKRKKAAEDAAKAAAKAEKERLKALADLKQKQDDARMSVDEYISSLRDQNTAVQASNEGWSDYYDELQAVAQAQRILADAGLELTEEREDQIRAIVRSTQELEKVADKEREIAEAADDLGFTFSSAFEDAIVNGAKLSDVLKGLEQDILRIITRQLVTKPLAGAISGALGGGGVLGGIFQNIFGGGKALGGPVMGGKAYLVGEDGPEMFVPPGGGGRIVPNNSVGGNLSVSINVNGVRDEGGLRMASSQIAAEAARAVQRGQRNL